VPSVSRVERWLGDSAEGRRGVAGVKRRKMKSRVAIVVVEGGLCEEEDWARREREGENFFRSYRWRRRWGPLSRRRRRSRKDEGSRK
jgi:hypothetical protein